MPLNLYNIGRCWKGLRISFHVVVIFKIFLQFWVSFITFWNFIKIPSVLKESRKTHDNPGIQGQINFVWHFSYEKLRQNQWGISCKIKISSTHSQILSYQIYETIASCTAAAFIHNIQRSWKYEQNNRFQMYIWNFIYYMQDLIIWISHSVRYCIISSYQKSKENNHNLLIIHLVHKHKQVVNITVESGLCHPLPDLNRPGVSFTATHQN
jgi:hypothetical protein